MSIKEDILDSDILLHVQTYCEIITAGLSRGSTNRSIKLLKPLPPSPKVLPTLWKRFGKLPERTSQNRAGSYIYDKRWGRII